MPTRNSKSESIIAESEAMQEVLDLVEQIAPTEVPVFITGETGVGKEVVAQAIHEKSPRKNQPFEAIFIYPHFFVSIDYSCYRL